MKGLLLLTSVGVFWKGQHLCGAENICDGSSCQLLMGSLKLLKAVSPARADVLPESIAEECDGVSKCQV